MTVDTTKELTSNPYINTQPPETPDDDLHFLGIEKSMSLVQSPSRLKSLFYDINQSMPRKLNDKVISKDRPLGAVERRLYSLVSGYPYCYTQP
jgi:hypothetical protein